MNDYQKLVASVEGIRDAFNEAIDHIESLCYCDKGVAMACRHCNVIVRIQKKLQNLEAKVK